MMTKTNHPFINADSSVRGDQPVIEGTGVRVLDIAIEYVYKGYSIDQIIAYHPHLELKQIHDALSYYYANQKKFDEKIKNDRAQVEELKNKAMKDSPKLESDYA